MVEELRHPLLVHKLNRIRDISTESSEIRTLLEDIASFMVYEALRSVSLQSRRVRIWIGERDFEFFEESSIVFVPILRAGLPMLEGALRVVPKARVGFLALKRDEKTLESRIYYSKLPDLEGARVLILDPMLATGGTLIKAIEEVMRGSPSEVLSLHVVCAPEGIERVSRAFPRHRMFTVSVDEGLNDRGFIIPGLGDMGDRLYS